MTERDDRTAGLIAAAVSGHLSAADQVAFDQACAADPTIGAEVAELRAIYAGLDEVSAGAVTPPADLEDRILAATVGEPHPTARLQVVAAGEAGGTDDDSLGPDRAGPPTPLRGRGRIRLLLAAAAVALVLAGGLGALGIQSWAERPPQGPPGTLGAVEDIDFTPVPADARVQGALVAHTWGTETVLEMDGLDPAEQFAVVLVDERGRSWDSGTFRGSEVTISCRMNAALLRKDVTAVEIRDTDGAVVTRADVPS